MIRRILLLAALLSTSCAPVSHIDIAKTPTRESFPEADVVWLDRRAEVTFHFNEDTGAPVIVVDHYQALKLLTAAAAQDVEHTTMSLVYDRTDQRIERLRGRTLLPGGGPEAVASQQVEDHPLVAGERELYSSTRIKTVSFPAALPGAVLELSYRQVHLDPRQPLSWTFAGLAPVLRSMVVLRAPPGLSYEAHYFAAGQQKPLRSSTRGEGEERRVTWRRDHLAPLPQEPLGPSRARLGDYLRIIPRRLRVGERDYHFPHTWEELGRFYGRVFEGRDSRSPEMKRLVARIIAGAPGDEERARRLYYYVSGKIRYVAIEYGKSRWQPSPARVTFGRGYGDCKDKAMLLKALLAEAGVKSHLALLGTTDDHQRELGAPSMGAFNHVILAINLAGRRVFVDPTSGTSPFGALPYQDLDTQTLVVKDGGIELARTPASRSEENVEATRALLHLREDSRLEGTANLVVTGQQAISLRQELIGGAAQQRAAAVEERLGLAPGRVRVAGVNILQLRELEQPLKVEVRVSAGGVVSRSKRWFVIHPDRLLGELLPRLPGGPRHTPLELGFRRMVKRHFAIRLPPGAALEEVPDDRQISTPLGRFSISYGRSAGSLSISCEVRRDAVTIPLRQYGLFKKFTKEARLVQNRPITGRF